MRLLSHWVISLARVAVSTDVSCQYSCHNSCQHSCHAVEPFHWRRTRRRMPASMHGAALLVNTVMMCCLMNRPCFVPSFMSQFVPTFMPRSLALPLEDDKKRNACQHVGALLVNTVMMCCLMNLDVSCQHSCHNSCQHSCQPCHAVQPFMQTHTPGKKNSCHIYLNFVPNVEQLSCQKKGIFMVFSCYFLG